VRLFSFKINYELYIILYPIHYIVLSNIEVIPNSSSARDLYLTLVKAAEEEILLIFPTTNSFIRQEKIGVIQVAKKVAKELYVQVRILMPVHESTGLSAQSLRGQNGNAIDVRNIEQTSGTQITILVVDRNVSLVMEIRDDSRETFDEAIGLSTYSNSKPGVLSYVAIFGNLWKQTELYENIKKSHEQLEVHTRTKTQKEFINLAEHELRTPIQPIADS
jgi:two-component system, OmpR family, sensor histidine kinase VicK